MKILQIEQGTPEWLAWRKTVITGTDCPAIRGSSPWSTAYKCWQRKLGLVEEQPMNEAMERGKRLEPEARNRFNDQHGLSHGFMQPAVVESTEFDFLGASLDGLSLASNSILEIKCGGSKLHNMALNGEIPDYYMDQIQHQLLVTGADRCFYYSYNGTNNGVIITVQPNPDFAKDFLSKARDFWRCVALNEAPPLQDSDYKDMSDNDSWKSMADRYANVCENIKALEEVKENYRKELLALSGNENCMGNGIKVMKTVSRGRVDYDAIPELQGLDLDKYRKASSTVWKICVV